MNHRQICRSLGGGTTHPCGSDDVDDLREIHEHEPAITDENVVGGQVTMGEAAPGKRLQRRPALHPQVVERVQVRAQLGKSVGQPYRPGRR